MHAFNMITGKNKSKFLTKYISCKCKCKFDGRRCNSDQKWISINVNASVKNIKHVKKIIFGVLLYVIVKMENIEQVVLMIEWFRMMKL